MNQSEFLQNVTVRNYIVGSISSNGSFSVSTSPVLHVNRAAAMAECSRLANLNPGKAYVTMQLSGAMLTGSTVVF